MRRILVAGFLLTGCATPVDGEPRGEQEATTTAYVVTTRTIGAADKTAARAAFVRVVDPRQVESVTTTLGLEPDLPAEGQCRSGEAVATAPMHAELVEAGEVWLGDERGETKMVARAFPDLLSVSGLVYTTADDQVGLGDDPWVRIKGGKGVDARVVRLGMVSPTIDARRSDDVLTFADADSGDRTWVDIGDALGSRRCTLARTATSFVLDALADAVITVHRDRRRTDGSLTVRMETVETLGRPVASSGT